MRDHYSYSAIQEALGPQEEMSADEKERYLADMNERALKNKNSELGAARRKGIKIGLKKGIEEGREEGEKIGLKKGIEEGRKEVNKKIAANMISMGAFSMEQISQATGLRMEEVRRLRNAERAGDS
ncbi:MAG: hypothetical protein GY859_01395 [Desulfobacterales bacterium]|nr:hypothetical protein [Desulfobacterales bacterium]